MSAANEESQSSSDPLPVRQGALDAEGIRAECPQFRILIIGKANAGKTTILRKVCNAKADAKPVVHDAEGNEVDLRVRQDVQQEVQQVPIKSRLSLSNVLQRMKGRSVDVPNPAAVDTPNLSTDVLNACGVDILKSSTQRGEHNIEYQLTYPGSKFIFHDSRGIEAGSEDELAIVQKFIQTREQHADLKKQLHVIWYCVPLDDQRPISGAEKMFFTLGIGRVPVVLIFTKFDALAGRCYNKLRYQGMNHQEAKSAMHELANKTFQDEYLPRVLDTEFPPKTYVCLAGMDKDENQCSELSEKTVDILDDDVLVNLFVSTQKNNLDLCIKKSIEAIWTIEGIQGMDMIYGLVRWFPNYWSSFEYQPAPSWSEPSRRRSWWILKTLSQQFPSEISKDKRKEYQGLLKFQMIAVVALLLEHSFWFSGHNIEEQLPHAIKSFKSQKNIKLVKAEVETAFNNATNEENSAWLTQLVINNKLKHK